MKAKLSSCNMKGKGQKQEGRKTPPNKLTCYLVQKTGAHDPQWKPFKPRNCKENPYSACLFSITWSATSGQGELWLLLCWPTNSNCRKGDLIGNRGCLSINFYCVWGSLCVFSFAFVSRYLFTSCLPVQLIYVCVPFLFCVINTLTLICCIVDQNEEKHRTSVPSAVPLRYEEDDSQTQTSSGATFSTIAETTDDMSSPPTSIIDEEYNNFEQEMTDPNNAQISRYQNTYFMDGGNRFISVWQWKKYDRLTQW